MLLPGGFQFAEHGVNVNPLAVIAAVIFAESLHPENFAHGRADAKKNCPPTTPQGFLAETR